MVGTCWWLLGFLAEKFGAVELEVQCKRSVAGAAVTRWFGYVYENTDVSVVYDFIGRKYFAKHLII